MEVLDAARHAVVLSDLANSPEVSIEFSWAPVARPWRFEVALQGYALPRWCKAVLQSSGHDLPLGVSLKVQDQLEGMAPNTRRRGAV